MAWLSCLTKYLTSSIEITQKEGKMCVRIVCVLAGSIMSDSFSLYSHGWGMLPVRVNSSLPLFFLWSIHLSLITSSLIYTNLM